MGEGMRRHAEPKGWYEWTVQAVVHAGIVLTLGVLLYLIIHVLWNGIPYVTADLFAFRYNTTNMSLFPSLVTTVYLVGGTLALSVPLGIGTALYMTEYARRSSAEVKLVRIANETLAAIPSIVYGLFGFLFFVTFCQLGYSLAAGILTMTILVLPLVVKTTEEALLTVPQNLREGSYGLGVGKKDTIMKIILPVAMRGVIAGIILAIGRIVGETVALMYTIGTVAEIPDHLLASGRTMAVHMYALSGEGLHTDKAYATGVILILTVLIMNEASAYIVRKWRK